MATTTQFYPLRVREVRRETPDTVSVALEVPEPLRETFCFSAGQYLTLRAYIDGEEVRRSYSLYSAPHEGEWRIAIKKVPGGVFSTYANERLRAGDELLVMPPQGRFTAPFSPENTALYVAFAAGSGITPIFSLLKSALHTEAQSRFLLFYGNRGFDHIIFREALEQLKNRHPERLGLYHIFSRESLGANLFCGRLDADKCRAYARYFFVPQEVDHYFLCGPEEMIFDLKAALEALGVAPNRIHFELFTTPGSTRKAARAPQKANETIEASVTVIQDGMTFDFVLPSDGSTLLDAAMRAGADLPFSCKGGVCSTCKAKVLEGEVEMEVCYGLEPDEIAAGYVLTCQTHPKSKRLVVSFDA